MLTNKPYGDQSKKGAEKGKSKVLNPKICNWPKSHTKTVKFLEAIKNGISFTEVRKVKQQNPLK